MPNGFASDQCRSDRVPSALPVLLRCEPAPLAALAAKRLIRRIARPRLDPLLVVVPAYNEAGSIADVLKGVQAAVPAAHLLVVDDGSTDRTRAIALAEGATVLSLPFNLGVGGAMRTGFRYAVRNGYTRVVQVDADGQHDPAQIPALLEALARADVVIGARFAGTGEYVVRGPRRWAMRMLARYLSRVTRTGLTDVTSGFRASGETAVELFAQHYPVEYLGDTVESLVIAAFAGLRVAQVAVSMRPRPVGNPSQTPLRALVYLLRACMALAFARMRWRSSRRPGVGSAVLTTVHEEDER
ncbi:MAG: glycosyltransferase family 2 protein [Amnibacterium sp.]